LSGGTIAATLGSVKKKGGRGDECVIGGTFRTDVTRLASTS
jgi:hypothetical protein